MAKIMMHPSTQDQDVLFLKLECAAAPIEILKIDVGSLIDDWQDGMTGVALRVELTCGDSQVVPAEYKAVAAALHEVAKRGSNERANVNRLSIKHEAALSQYTLSSKVAGAVVRFSAAAKSTVLIVDNWDIQLRWVVDCTIPAKHLTDLVRMKSEDDVIATIENLQLDLWEVRFEHE